MHTTVAQTRELTGEELDLVSGAMIWTSRVGGFTFTYNAFTNETTVGAGDITVTTDPGRDPNNGRCKSITVTGPT